MFTKQEIEFLQTLLITTHFSGTFVELEKKADRSSRPAKARTCGKKM